MLLFRADEGCLQWFTGQGGRVQSFNNLDLNGIMIKNLLYTICIRNEEGTVPCIFIIFQDILKRANLLLKLSKSPVLDSTYLAI